MSSIIKMKWVVIGAGPSGILNIGKLLDYKINSNNITWIDPYFNVGRLGKYYENVPSNTKIKTFNDFLDGCISFDYNNYKNNFKISKLNPENTCQLKNIIEPLKIITNKLSNDVNVIEDFVNRIYKNEDNYIIEFEKTNKKIIAENIILSTGCVPKTQKYNKNQIRITLDDALDLDRLMKYIEPNDIVGVNGTSHSGILVLKNLSKLNIKSIISYSNRPLRYAIYKNNSYIYDNTGLKGDTALWAKSIYEKDILNNLIKTSNKEDLNNCNKIIDAIGFKRVSIPGLEDDLLNNYNNQIGIISNNLYGSGIAFPKKVLDLSGNFEQDVGLGKFLKHSDEMIKLWINKK